ncbi:MAG: hypothetical protein ACKOEM_20690, partial [Planctomycetia bacterium]
MTAISGTPSFSAKSPTVMPDQRGEPSRPAAPHEVLVDPADRPGRIGFPGEALAQSDDCAAITKAADSRPLAWAAQHVEIGHGAVASILPP